MEKIDLKDRKILYYLIQDSRQPLSNIGKKIRQSKELVSYRVKRLQEKGIIQKFTTIIDDTKLGYFGLVYNYKFDNINPLIRSKIIDFLADSKYTRYVASTEGKYDMIVWYNILNQKVFIDFYEKLLTKHRKYLASQILTGDIGVEFFPYDFLLSDNQRHIPHTKTKKPALRWLVIEEIDELDISILRELSNNPRIKLIEIAKKLKSSSNTIKYRIKLLIEKEVIVGFSTIVDWSKIGYNYFTLEIYLNDYTQKNKILEYLTLNPHLIKIFKTVAQGVDIKFDIILYNVEHLRKINQDITNTFPNSIKNIDYYNTYKINKIDYLPPAFKV